MGVGDLGGATADREVIAAGKALAPGFIDAHTHDDRAVLCGPDCMRCKIIQGVTTVVVGNCGVSLSPVRMTSAPVAAARPAGRRVLVDLRQLRRVRRGAAQDPPPVNTYALVGHQTLRVEAMDGDLTAGDRQGDRRTCRPAGGGALAEGASGFSTGLYYPPNMMRRPTR